MTRSLFFSGRGLCARKGRRQTISLRGNAAFLPVGKYKVRRDIQFITHFLDKLIGHSNRFAAEDFLTLFDAQHRCGVGGTNQKATHFDGLLQRESPAQKEGNNSVITLLLAAFYAGLNVLLPGY